MRPLIVASDLHLSPQSSGDTARALAALVESHHGHEVILAGDVLNLSWEAAGRSAAGAVVALLERFPALKSTLREHLAKGLPLTFIAGNHDAGVMAPDLREAILLSLGLASSAPLEIAPWFVRRGKVHVEHGHFYDPDNAPAHPLAEWSPETEPLGVAVMRRFVGPTGTYQFSHAHETTPVAAILKSFQAYGARTPLIIAQWFRCAGTLCLESRDPRRFDAELRAGQAALENFSKLVELDVAALESLLHAGPVPTHRNFKRTFMRLYFDRVFGTSGLLLSGAAYLAWKSRAAGMFGLLAGLYLIQSVQRTGNRYEALPVERLRTAAARVRQITGAEAVIFGHTHVVDEIAGYANSGSFGYSAQGRPYVQVNEQGELRNRRT